MKKIVHVGYYHSYLDVRILKKECKALSRKYKVTYVTSNRNGITDTKKIENTTIIIHALRGKRYLRLLRYLHDLKRILIELDADVYHIHEHVLLPLIPFLRRHNKKVVYDMHESIKDDYRTILDAKLGKIIGGKLTNAIANYEKRMIKKAQGFIYVTPSFISSGHESTLMELIPNFPIIDDDAFVEKTFEQFLSCKGVACFAGGISEVWSQLNFLDALNNFPEMKYILAGPCDKEYLSRLKTKPAWHNVDYLGKIPFEKVKDLYAQSYIGIALMGYVFCDEHRVGTLGNTKIFEYMQAGLPIICTDFQLWKEILLEYPCGIYVNPEKTKEIVEAIKYLLDNPKDAYDMGKQGQDAVREKYNWGESEVRLLRFYEKILEE